MSFKQALEDHIAIFFLGTLATGFLSGWGAFSAIQFATNRTSISIERLKQLEGPDAIEKKTLQTRIEELELERNSLLQQLAVNRPKTGNYVRNVILTPKSPAVLPIGARIKVKYDYVLTKGEEADIWARGDGSNWYSASSPVSGSGTDERELGCNKAGKVREVTISMCGKDGCDLYNMTLPVDYTFK